MKNKASIFINEKSLNIYCSKRRKKINFCYFDFINDSIYRNKLIKKALKFSNRWTIILEGKEVFIKNTTLPHMPLDDIRKVLECKLKKEFDESFESIEFSYKIIEKDEDRLDVAILFINRSDYGLLIKNCKHTKVDAVYIVQDYYMQFATSLMSSKNFLLIYLHDNHLYIDLYNRGVIKKESLIKNVNNNIKKINNIIRIWHKENNNVNIYTVNIEEEFIDEFFKDIDVVNLGTYERYQMIC